VVELLVTAGAWLDVQNEFGYTALFFAAEQQHSRIAHFLVVRGADPDLASSDGEVGV
jgi:ankyrin repeat protein